MKYNSFLRKIRSKIFQTNITGIYITVCYSRNNDHENEGKKHLKND